MKQAVSHIDIATAQGGSFPFDMAVLVDALPDAVLVINDMSQIVFANLSAAQMLGHTHLTDKSLNEFFTDTHPIYESLRSGTDIHGVSVMTQQDVTIQTVPLNEYRMIVIKENSHVFKDQWLKKIRHTLSPAQHIARVLAHEIKNPLAGIKAAGQLLSRSGLKPDDHELAQMVYQETERVLRLIDKVNVFDAVKGDFKDMNIHHVLDQAKKVIEPMFSGKMIEEYDPSLPDIYGDEDSLIRVVLNLMKNAIEAGADKITLRTFYDTTPMFHPETHQKLPLCLEVKDNGHGMDADTLTSIFTPYFTTKDTGEGLGLAIVSKMIDDHDGLMHVTSQKGETIFKISFPRKG